MATLFAVDVSGSTTGNYLYWRKVESIFKSLDMKNTLLVAWGSDATIVNRHQMQREIDQLCVTQSGTAPEYLAGLLKTIRFRGKLILVTDGEIPSASVEHTDQALKDWGFEFVQVYLVSSSNIDLSVTAPFTRNTKFEIFANDTNLSSGRSDIKLDLSQYDTPETFLSEFENLKSTIVIQNIGKNNEQLRDDLLKLQKSLLAQISKLASGAESYGITKSLKDGNYDESVQKAKTYVNKYLNGEDSNITTDISNKIQALVRACTSKGVYSTSILQNVRVNRADNMTKAEEIEQIDTSEQNFECPVMLEQDVPALLIQATKPILDGEEKSVVDMILTCPLYLLNFQHLVQKVKDVLDHPIGCNTIVATPQIYKRSPFTRRDIGSFLPLGVDKTHISAADWTISRLFTGGKIIGNINLWYSVLWYIFRDVEWLKTDEAFMSAAQTALVYRMENFTTHISLSGLPEFPLVKSKVGTAIWYCVASGDFFAEKPIEQDRLRTFYPIARYLTGILDVLGYPYKKEYTQKRIDTIRAFYFLSNCAKENKNHKVFDLIRAQYQNHIRYDDDFVFLDGHVKDFGVVPPELPEPLRGVSFNHLLKLKSRIDTSKKNSAVLLSNEIALNNQNEQNNIDSQNTSEYTEAKYNYIYRPGDANILSRVDICPLTMRPYYIDRQTNEEWEVCNYKLFGELKYQLSVPRLYMTYITETQFPHPHLPTEKQFALFCQRKQFNKTWTMDTLPFCFKEFFEYFNNAFGEALEQLENPKDIKRMIKLYQDSVAIPDRRVIENKWNEMLV